MKKRKILIYMPYATWIPHLGTDLEIAARHIDKGDDVHIIQCSGDLPSCETNPSHTKLRCVACRYQRDKGLSLINLPDQNRHELALNNFYRCLDLPDFHSIEELTSFEINNVDIGMAVASTLISKTRDPNPNLCNFKNYINKNILMSNSIYNAIKYHLQQIEPDIFYLFNGRFAAIRPALRAAQGLGIKTFVHERAGVLQKYTLWEDTYPHDIEYQKKIINHFWYNGRPDNEKEEIAKQWFEDRRRGKDQGWYSYTKSQKKRKMPDGFDASKRNVSIYISSEDEFAAIEGWQNPIYKNQTDAINAIINADLDENIWFYIRIHPNMKGLDNTQTKELSELKGKNFTVISADSKIDSYELIDACEKVITFGSTVGIESVYWGKPSILAGRSVYEDLEGCYIPKDHEEFIHLINDHLNPLSNLGAMKYGYFQSLAGIPYKYYNPDSLFKGKFKGVDLSYSVSTKMKIIIKYINEILINSLNVGKT
ncbi:MAG: hypothetical protein WA144_13080 [Candidatus Methanoperedens sp.]